MPPGFALTGWLAASIAVVVAIAVLRWHATTLESVARVSHELRGPLTAVRLGLHLGTRGAQLTETRIRALDLELSRAAAALDDLTAVRHRPLLGSPGPRRGARAGTPVDLRALLSDCVEAAQAAALTAGAALRLIVDETPMLVRGDRVRLAQATGNLIANAIEHGGGEIEIRCRADRIAARVEVIDGGAGLPAPVRELIRRPRGGRGVRGRGLAIASAVAEIHGGRLAAAPSERGARLVLELPCTDGPSSGEPFPGGGRPRA
jgi:signal transduction histidine kinase